MKLPDGFDEALNDLLSSPDQLRKITELAQTLTGTSTASSDTEPVNPGGFPFPEELNDPRLLGLISKLFRAYRTDGDKDALVHAMEPFLRSERKQALRKALMAVKLTHAAKIALREMGGDFFV